MGQCIAKPRKGVGLGKGRDRHTTQPIKTPSTRLSRKQRKEERLRGQGVIAYHRDLAPSPHPARRVPFTSIRQGPTQKERGRGIRLMSEGGVWQGKTGRRNGLKKNHRTKGRDRTKINGNGQEKVLVPGPGGHRTYSLPQGRKHKPCRK